jgi:hypothetical protein
LGTCSNCPKLSNKGNCHTVPLIERFRAFPAGRFLSAPNACPRGSLADTQPSGRSPSLALVGQRLQSRLVADQQRGAIPLHDLPLFQIGKETDSRTRRARSWLSCCWNGVPGRFSVVLCPGPLGVSRQVTVSREAPIIWAISSCVSGSLTRGSTFLDSPGYSLLLVKLEVHVCRWTTKRPKLFPWFCNLQRNTVWCVLIHKP